MFRRKRKGRLVRLKGGPYPGKSRHIKVPSIGVVPFVCRHVVPKGGVLTNSHYRPTSKQHVFEYAGACEEWDHQ